MRHRLASQLRQSTDICIFCALRNPYEIQFLRDNLRQPRRGYNASSATRTPAGAAAVQKEDDDEDVPLLRQNSGAALRSSPISFDRSRRSPPTTRFPSTRSDNLERPPKEREGGFRIRKVDFSGENGDIRRPQRSWYRNADQQPQNGISQIRDQRAENNPQRSWNRPPYLRSGLDSDPNSREQGQRRGAPQRNSTGSTPLNTSDATQDSRSRVPRPFGVFSDPNRENQFSQRGHDRFPSRQPPLNRDRESVSSSYEPMQRRSTPRDGDDRLMAEIRNMQIPKLEGEIAQEDDYLRSRRSKSTGRFQETPGDDTAEDSMDGKRSKRRSRFEVDDELDLPASSETQKSSNTKDRGYRKFSQDFDFELFEAEKALNGEQKRRKKRMPKQRAVEPVKPTLIIPEFVTVQQLAQSMKVKVDDLIRKLEEEGFEGARFDHMLDAETSAIFADMYGFEPVAGGEEMQDLVARPSPEDASSLPPRPPIVTIMGHVDHGKTTILDWLRKSSVAADEHGGITQHIGAFSVTMPGSERQITFLDTPGHEAFLDMRRRGANVTDIVVLVVAADDSVKPQTVEAIKHALEARVQLIVAINKVDKHDANIEQVKSDLTRHEIVVEDYGGDYQAIPVSGKTGQGMEQLEEAIITLADVLDLRAEQDGPAEGQIIESKVTNAGRVATVLVRRGVLRVGDFIVAGPTWGRVRTLRNDAGQLVQEAYPGDPVQVDGWRGSDPTAGLEVLQANDEQHAKDVVDLRNERARQAQSAVDMAAMNAAKSQEAEARAKVLAWEAENAINPRRRRDNEGWVDSTSSSGPKLVHFVVKADVAGSVEAIVAAVSAMGNHEVQANVIHSGTGPVAESDIRMLATTGETSYAISFNQHIEGAMHSLAEAAGLQILDHNIIYKVTDAVKAKLNDALPPLITQRVLGEAEVGKIFDVTIKKEKIKIAGCKVTNGTISRANQVRVVRNGETVYTGTLESLKNVKKDVTEMRKGTECGMGFKEWEGVQEGDQVQCFEEKTEKRTLY